MKILKNIIITAAMLAAATAICFILRPLVPTDTHVPLIYVLAVLCVSRLTEGYFYGVLASMVAVVGVNYIFTYPYFPSGFYCDRLSAYIYCNVDSIFSVMCIDDSDQDAGACAW